jgi:uncharacterized membrane protein YeaQ/YmgE (transglycosylase-associated protein family)
MEVVGYILGLALTGLVVGALARLLLPGRDPMSIFETMLVGIAGTLIAGLITYYLFDRATGPGLLLSIICALALVFAVRKLRERHLGSAAQAQQPSQAGFGGAGFGTTQVHFFPGCLIGSLLISLFLTVGLNLLLRAF